MLRKLRIILAAIVFILCAALFLDGSGTVSSTGALSTPDVFYFRILIIKNNIIYNNKLICYN